MKTPEFFLLFCLFDLHFLSGQEPQAASFTRTDTLRGALSPERTCFDVTYEHLKVSVDPAKKFISGYNSITFRATKDFTLMQIDLFANMNVDSILLDHRQNVPHKRELNAVFITVPLISQDSYHTLDFHYSGFPQEAKNPPWQGGFTWTTDKQGNPWVVVTCQGTGASLWWPNKDHQSDEPDSMLISITVPPGLEDVSNGKLRSKTIFSNGWTQFDWFVGNPINNYNVTINVGKFAHFSESFRGEEGEFSLDYYVLPENLEKAKVQFRQVRPMMKCFERYFGPYPFSHDGYKLVESPHNGMEHQSAVAYGNLYIQGYRGRTWAPVGLKFDFIIIHESAHEWWGNSVTSEDIADMWIHESFGAYAEALYVECMYGRKESLEYVNGKKSNARNTQPIIGVYNVHKQGSGDMYDKGQLVLNTLRSVINKDSLWFAIIRGIATTFRARIVHAEDVFTFINSKTGTDYSYFFEQYLKRTSIPVLQVQISRKGKDITARYRWIADVAGFAMPVKVTTSPGKYEFIYPTTEWKSSKLSLKNPTEFKVAEDLFYIEVRKSITYLDPNTPVQPARRQ